MALSIRAISKATLVNCGGVNNEAGEPCDHEEVGPMSRRQDGLKPGCYLPGMGGRTFSFEIGYKEYGAWMLQICRDALGAEWEEVCKHPRRYRGQPFLELIDIPYLSDGQTLGPRTSAKLHADVIGFAARARNHFLRPPDRAWMWEVYRDFRKAFKLGADAGFVSYW
jgi:hypothetical protein